ncbi:MAG: hypothetical protein KKD94_06335, partial [Nanoarchaeota archaeon]|nr:hypothetical protein [Nanoarchaeota archaeon]
GGTKNKSEKSMRRYCPKQKSYKTNSLLIYMNVKNLVLGIGIIIVFALVLWQGIEAFYPSPQWDGFCDESIEKPIPLDREQLTQTECEEQGGVWKNNYCDYYSECQREFDESKDKHTKIVFIVSIIVGIVVIILGYSILSLEPVGSALIASGIWAIFYGSAINWRNFSSVIRFALLLLALILLIWLAMRLNRTVKKIKKK